MPLTIHAADARSVTFSMDSDPRTVGMHHVADALTLSIVKGHAPLAGVPVDEQSLIELMSAMRRAGGFIQCGQCRSWTTRSGTSDLCGHCADELRDQDRRMDDSRGEY